MDFTHKGFGFVLKDEGIPSQRYALRLFVFLRCDNRVKFPNLCSSLFPSESCEVLFFEPLSISCCIFSRVMVYK